MSDVIKRVSVEGLRGSDVATIQVLTQDVLGLPVNQISAGTVCDLFALAEVSDQVPEQLASDLSAFVARQLRDEWRRAFVRRPAPDDRCVGRARGEQRV